MSEFSERLEGLMIENDLNRKTLAATVKINATCISHYMLDKRVPTVESLVKIADCFNRSTDFLLGFEEERCDLSFKRCPPFSERIIFLKKHFNRPAYYFYTNTVERIPKSSYYGWVSGERQPTLDNVIKLARLFNCRVDFILGRES